MSEGEKPALRGEAAWLAAREQVAKKNAETRKAGKVERDANDQAKADGRRLAEVRRAGELAKSSKRAS
jgi:hypothetical protein